VSECLMKDIFFVNSFLRHSTVVAFCRKIRGMRGGTFLSP